MESEWELDRIQLFQLRRDHHDWTLPRLAQELNRSLSWVKKWLKRFQEAGQPTLAMFQSSSRAPQHRLQQVVEAVPQRAWNVKVIDIFQFLGKLFVHDISARIGVWRLQSLADMSSFSTPNWGLRIDT